MSVELGLILGFLFHLLGDYILQNDWMAVNKTRSHLPAFVHAFVYSFPFLLFLPWTGWFVVFITHFFIDRYRLAIYLIKLVNWNWGSDNFGYDENKPQWMAVWLMIIIDNIWHVGINSSVILYYLF